MNALTSGRPGFVRFTSPAHTEGNVVKSCKESLLHNPTTFTSMSGGLAEQAMRSLSQAFASMDHHPSTAMKTALYDVLLKLEAMAKGTCNPSIFLSSLDPGVGKTQTVVHFVQALLKSPDYSDVGVIICLSRLDEIAQLTKAMDIGQDQFAVFTSDNELNCLGSATPNKARVLFTTQQMIEKRCEGQSFCQTEAFHFQGQPRQVRIWDEAILPGRTLTVNRDELFDLIRPLRPNAPDLAAVVEKLADDLKGIDDGSAFKIPHFADEFGVGNNDVLRLLEGNSPNCLASASALWLVSGKTVTVRKDGTLGNTVLDYQETLPDDIAPVVVLDASGRVRSAYDQWECQRGGLTRLRPAPKRYENLVIHVWTTGGGKSAFRRKGQELLDGIVSTINTKPEEDWLVVHHKDGIGMDFESEVRDLVKGNPNRVNFLHWGNHHGTNAYADVPNVILAGTLFYRPSYYESLGRLVSGKPSEEGIYGKNDRREIMAGEHRHLILQALCRGAVRKAHQDQCAPCNAYIIASVRSGIPAMLKQIFPGCRLKRWQPARKALKGKVKEAFDYLTQRFLCDPEAFVSFAEVREAIDMASAQNFRKNIRLHSQFNEELAQADIIEYGNGRYPRGFRKINAALYGFQCE